MTRTAIQVLALGLTFVSCFHLVQAGLGLSPEVILHAANPPWNNFHSVAQTLSAQRADTLVGFVVFLAAILLQSAIVTWPPRERHAPVSKLGVSIGVAITLIALAVSCFASSAITERTYGKVDTLRQQHESR
jgi:hypothetical protein